MKKEELTRDMRFRHYNYARDHNYINYYIYKVIGDTVVIQWIGKDRVFEYCKYPLQEVLSYFNDGIWVKMN